MMNEFDKLFPEDLYHTYIVEGEPKEIMAALSEFLVRRGILSLNSPDIFYRHYDAFTIRDSHEVKSWHQERGISDRKKVCILGAYFLNHDAERTLLKIFEEPKTNNHFFLVVPNASVLLDTIISRAHIIRSSSDDNSNIIYDINKFMKLSLQERVDVVDNFVKKVKDSEDSSSILRHNAITFINELEKVIYDKFKKNKSKDLNFILEELSKSREYLGASGASTKMILEHIALMV